MTRFSRALTLQVAGAAAFLAAVPVVVPPAIAFAQQGAVVESIEFEGNRRYSSDTLRLTLRTKVGQPLDRAVLPEDINTLYQYFDTVDLREEQTAAGVKLVFRVTENPPVTAVEFQGVSGVELSEVQAVVETSTGRPLADFRLENDQRKVERLYRSKGWHFVQVSARADETPDGGRLVVFEVLEGPQVSVKSIEIEGNASLGKDRLLSEAKTSETGFLGLGGGDFVEETLRQDLLAMRALYRAEGWLDADVTLGDLAFSDDREDAFVRIRVTEGQPYVVGSIAIEGVRAFPGGVEALRSALTITEGDRKRDEALYRTAQAIERAYRDEGFFAAVVEPVQRLRPEGGVVDLVFNVEEASKVRLRNLAIHGNVVTKDNVIRREVRLAPGDVLNQNEIDKAVRRLRDLQYFERVTPRIEPAAEGDDPNQRDVTIEVDDTAPTGQVRFAVGATSDFGLLGELSVTKRNFDWTDWPSRFGDIFTGRAFTGGGQTFYLTLAPGTDRSQYAIGFTEPWIFDRPISFSWDLFLKQFSRFEYDEDNRGVNLTFGKRWTVVGRERDTEISFGATTRIENHEVDGVSRDSAPTAFLAEGSNSLLAERFSLRIANIDSVRTPTDGWVAQASTEIGLGGDVSVWKTNLEYGRYWPVFRTDDERVHTFSINVSLGLAEPLGSSIGADDNLFGEEDIVPVYESYFAGGASSIRGFAFGGAGPHGEGNPFLARKPGESKTHATTRLGRTIFSTLENDGDPLGGNVQFTASAEYGFPIFQDVLRGVAFMDSGMVRNSWDSTHGLDEDVVSQIRRDLLAGGPAQRRLGRSIDFDDGNSFFGDMRMAVGFGIRLRIPALGPVPIALDFGIPIQKESGDDTQVLSFSIERRF